MAMTVLDPTTFFTRTVPDDEGAALLAAGWILAPGGSGGGGGVTDAAVADKVANGTATKAALSATYSQRASANSAVVLGDSTACYTGIGNGQSPVATSNDNWFHQLCARSRQRIAYTGVYATGGYTVEQVRDVHLPTVLALNPRPALAFVLCGHNNSRTTTAGMNAAKAAYRQIIEPLIAAGIRPVICLNLAQSAAQLSWNLWLSAYGARMKVSVVDTYSATADPAALTARTALCLSGDTLHPNSAGYRAIAQKLLADGVTSLVPPAPVLTTRSTADTTDLAGGRGVFGVDSNSDGRDDRWISVGTFSSALVTPDATDPVIGKWQRTTRTSAQSGSESALYWNGANSIATGFTVGDVLEASAVVRSSGFEAAGKTYTVRLVANGATGSPNIYLLNKWGADVADPAVVTRRFTVEAGTTSLKAEIRVDDPAGIAGTLQVDVADLTVKNLTTTAALVDAA